MRRFNLPYFRASSDRTRCDLDSLMSRAHSGTVNLACSPERHTRSTGLSLCVLGPRGGLNRLCDVEDAWCVRRADNDRSQGVTGSLHKGQSGRVDVLGGALECVR
ncbi:hypothetical protein L226DRAFT_94170 [Lentinus tigrinus ALCF2SS1-7]|uniref:uncharacterized protein n=1 Tax=Lentinus tigrinus ALCF2SS1-7 TaxID=1328758 RepID=UPI0011661C4C|nr:hypothetical protein L226DRAFT_94170 [Lentinus tigrinus ALCF2SS1-7]